MLGPRSRSEIDFLEKKSEKVAISGKPPPRLATCVIYGQLLINYENIQINRDI